MPTVEQAGQLVGGDQVFKLAHHAAQGVLMGLQGIAPLAHALACGLNIAGIQAQPAQHHQQGTGLQRQQRPIEMCCLPSRPGNQPNETAQHQQRAAHKHPPAQVKQAEHQDQGVEHQEGAAALVKLGQQPGLPGDRQQHLELGQARVVKAQVATAGEHPAEQQLAHQQQAATQQQSIQGGLQMTAQKRHPDQRQHQQISASRHEKAFEEKFLQRCFGHR
ncbi:hypothetical protein D9M71_453900 [compost metagenome]